MKSIATIVILLFSNFLFAQATLSGTVVDKKGNPIAGANIFIEGTYDGATSDDVGFFSFTTDKNALYLHFVLIGYIKI